LFRNEHLALLAILNDERRSDVRELGHRLQMLRAESVRSLLDQTLEHANDASLLWKADPLLGLILKETTGREKFNLYLKSIEQYQTRGVKIIDYWDKAYPGRLRYISNPPLLLFVKGTVFPGASPIAVVGTRRASLHARKLAREYASLFAEQGRTVVSGLARGIDSAAHAGALESKGSTVAILAGHIDHIYPPENAKLAQAIRSNGALVSEVTRHAFLHQGRFVERNRITSGLSKAVVVVESVRTGGTLQQVKFSLSQGRPTYVIDQGEFENPEAKEGFRRLIEMGAVAIQSPKEVAD
jgi:DNA processing protein